MTIFIPLWVIIVAWVAMKFVVACYLQRLYILTFPSTMNESPKAFRHFLGNWFFQPEFHVLRVVLWPLGNLVTWDWNLRDLLPDEISRYREKYVADIEQTDIEQTDEMDRLLVEKERIHKHALISRFFCSDQFIYAPAKQSDWKNVPEEWFDDKLVEHGWYSETMAQMCSPVVYLTPDGKLVVITAVTKGLDHGMGWDDVVSVGHVIPVESGGCIYDRRQFSKMTNRDYELDRDKFYKMKNASNEKNKEKLV